MKLRRYIQEFFQTLVANPPGPPPPPLALPAAAGRVIKVEGGVKMEGEVSGGVSGGVGGAVKEEFGVPAELSLLQGAAAALGGVKVKVEGGSADGAVNGVQGLDAAMASVPE